MNHPNSCAKRRIRIALIICAILIIGVVYFTLDPGSTRFIPKCLFHQLTGWDCPGCGSQRMLHALLHGNISAAWHYNALLLCMIPLLIPMILLEIYRDRFPRLYLRVHSIPVIITIVAIILAWWLLRNIY